jgi:hypothetical protein
MPSSKFFLRIIQDQSNVELHRCDAANARRFAAGVVVKSDMGKVPAPAFITSGFLTTLSVRRSSDNITYQHPITP